MLNSRTVNRVSNNTNIEINAVSGSILKNHPKSWFEYISLGSGRSNQLFVEGGHKGNMKRYEYCDGYPIHGENDIIVLQVMLCSNQTVIAECVYRKDFEVDTNE